MIDLTPLDVRNKRGDFAKILRGYAPQEVDGFLELVAERLEALVRENLSFRERVQILQQQVDSLGSREQAVQEALVTAQELRADMREQARRESEHIIKQAETEGRRLIAEAEAEVRSRVRSSERQMDQGMATLGELERRRRRFLKSFRQLLERELDVVEVEEGRPPLEERAIDLDLGSRRSQEPAVEEAHSSDEARSPDEPPPLDASVDELAAAFASETSADPGEDASPEPREDNLLLYLESDDAESDAGRG